jgi:hypothetical protein
VCSALGIAQVPETSLYVFRLTQDDTLRWHVHSPAMISGWNPGRYTNQPEWTDNRSLLVSAQVAGETQNDIYHLDLRSNTVRRMTKTPESEFSPLVSPDEQHFSTIRQVHGDELDQQVYVFPLNLDSPGEPVLTQIRNTGYHCWLNANTLALYLVDDPPKLSLASVDDGTQRIYSSGIGRCLRRTANGHLAYVHKYSDAFWFLKILDTESLRSDILIETLHGKEDFAISASGDYFMSSGSILYVFSPQKSPARWEPVYDLGVFGLQNITRLAISKDNWIAIVDQKM